MIDITDLKLGDVVRLSDGVYRLERLERKRMPTLGMMPNWVFKDGKKEQRFTGRIPIEVEKLADGMYILSSLKEPSL